MVIENHLATNSSLVLPSPMNSEANVVSKLQLMRTCPAGQTPVQHLPVPYKILKAIIGVVG